jgi:hypothetical protein
MLLLHPSRLTCFPSLYSSWKFFPLVESSAPLALGVGAALFLGFAAAAPEGFALPLAGFCNEGDNFVRLQNLDPMATRSLVQN